MCARTSRVLRWLGRLGLLCIRLLFPGLLLLNLESRVLAQHGIRTLYIDEIDPEVLQVVVVAFGLEREASEVSMDGGEFLWVALRLQDALAEESEAYDGLLDLYQEVHEGGADFSEPMVPSVLFLSWQLAQ